MSNVRDFPGGPNRRQAIEPFQPINISDWHDKPVPERRWLVPGMLLRGTVSLLSGDGGLGKSLLMQQLMTASAVGRPWLGLDVPRVRSFAFFCEDDDDELWRRQADINAHYDANMIDVAHDVSMTSRVGQDNLLMEFPYRGGDKGTKTRLYEQVLMHIRDFGAQLVIIDTAADTFGGNEIIRPQVRAFVNALRRFAMETDGGVILTAHPSVQGMTTGSGISGSTAWSNSVRGRSYLTRPKHHDDEEGDPDERVLKLMKSNYGRTGNEIRLRWHQGVFQPAEHVSSSAPLGMVERYEIERHVLNVIGRLCRSGTRMSPDRFARTYVVSAICREGALRAYSRGEIEAAKDRLIEAGKLVQVTVRRDRKERVYVKPADMRLPEEEGETE
jgi:RecA-family ATPase